MQRKCSGEMVLTTHNANTGVSGTKGTEKGQNVACLNFDPLDGTAIWSTARMLQKHHGQDSSKFARKQHIPQTKSQTTGKAGRNILWQKIG